MLHTLKLQFPSEVYCNVFKISDSAHADQSTFRGGNIISKIMLRAPFQAAQIEIAISQLNPLQCIRNSDSAHADQITLRRGNIISEISLRSLFYALHIEIAISDKNLWPCIRTY